MTKAIAVAAVAAVVGTSGLRAQNPAMPPHDPATMMQMSNWMGWDMQAMMGQMQGMVAVHAYAPQLLLDRKTDLALTADQAKKLEDLSAEVKSATDHAVAEHNIRHLRVMEQFKLAKPDPAKVKADGQEAMNDMAAAHGVVLSAAARAKALLTDAQRTKVDQWATEHAGMMHHNQ